jgi:hypothetical protein
MSASFQADKSVTYLRLERFQNAEVLSILWSGGGGCRCDFGDCEVRVTNDRRINEPTVD